MKEANLSSLSLFYFYFILILLINRLKKERQCPLLAAVKMYLYLLKRNLK